MARERMLSESVIEQFLHYDSIQDRLIFRLINAEKNRKYLENKVGSTVVSKEIADFYSCKSTVFLYIYYKQIDVR